MRPLARLNFSAILTFAAILCAGAGMTGCGGSGSSVSPGPTAPTRTWRMGFSGIPPVPDQTISVNTIFAWSPRADAAIAHEGVPWDSLLAGVPADTLARRYLGLMQYYRLVAHHAIWFEVDPTDGLARTSEDPKLVNAGRSISEPAVRALYVKWVTAVDTLVHPEYLGLASEVNLVRFAGPTVYASLGPLARQAADSLLALHARRPDLPRPKLYATLQVETLWGRLGPAGWQGVATEAADFSWAEAWGLSSYPYLGGFAEPEDIPADYFSRPAAELGKPVMVVEGGWASVPYAGTNATPAQQARWLRRQATLLDAAHAVALFDLTYADLALSTWPLPPTGSLVPFAHLGVVDSALTAKPALAVWDSLYARTRVN
ncbi:MAG: hypothetical protein U0704_11660 [Candidatus Eisenbacteria bacterium]